MASHERQRLLHYHAVKARSLIISLYILLLACVCAQAKPARPSFVRYTQPDGSTLLLRLQGDENGHYALDRQGRVLELDAEGFYRLSPTPESFLRRRILRHPSSRIQPRGGAVPSRLRIAVILVEFQDVNFVLPQPLRHFERLLNEPGYAEDGATGSVRDFCLDNSDGRFDPQFEVFGPVRLSHRRSYYGADLSEGEEQGTEAAFLEACRLLEDEIDYSRFDEDGDGRIDQLAFFYAGHDQSEGAPSEAFWSHHGNFAESGESSIRNARIGSLSPGEYICMAELQGAEGSRPMGIGSTCHELGHSLGLPDFYDTDGSGSEGQAGGLYQFSTMGLGMYNNDGRTPPYFNALERQLLGWLPPENILPLPRDGSFRIGPVQESIAYRSETNTEGEYFLYECRSGEGWDAPLPKGLVIYHVDQSGRPVGGELPAAALWENWRTYNNLNNNGKHPCFYLVPAADNAALNYPDAWTMPGSLVFPGSSRVLSFEPMDWDHAAGGVQLVCIAFADGASSARAVQREGRFICGEVRDPDGKPVNSVTISVNGVSPVLSSADGFFLLPLQPNTPDAVLLSASKLGYRPFSREVNLDGRRIGCLPLTLLPDNTPAMNPLSKWDRKLSRGYFPTPEAAIGAVRLTPEDLAPYAHQRLSKIVCYPYIGETAPGQLWVTVDIDGERVLTRAVPSSGFLSYDAVEVDISDADIRIPEGRAVYLGYGFEGGNPIGVVYPGVQGNSFWKPLANPKAPWKEVYSTLSGYYMDVMVEAVATEVPGETLDAAGYAYIDPGTGTPLEGETFLLKVFLPEGEHPDIRWTYDNKDVTGNSITLGAGEHVLRAILSYPDGRQEILQRNINI